MRWNFLRRDAWPSGVPRLYAGPAEEIAPFLDEAEIERLYQLPLVRVVAQLDPDGGDDAELLTGCARLLIRNLMPVRDLSVRGPEDSPPELRGEDPEDEESESWELLIAMRSHRDRILVTLEGAEKLRLEISLDEIRRDPQNVWGRASRQIVEHLGLEVSEELLAAWGRGQPLDADSLKLHGSLVLGSGAKSNEDIVASWRRDPAYATLLWSLEEPYPREALLEGLEQDPDNAQLCFLLFCCLWQDGGFEPWAMQYCRKAIELSPGHGKAHMCLPHAAPDRIPLLVHSELGARFLPTNPFALSNYFNSLKRWGCRDERMMRLAQACVQLDPMNPGGYKRIIEQLLLERRFDEAVEVSAALCELYRPPMDERTRYCLTQNPTLKDRLQREGWSPYQDSLRELARLERLARCGEIV